MDRCKAFVPNEEVWALLSEWSWLEAWDTGISPMQAVHYALVDVLAPEIGAFYKDHEISPHN